MGTFERMSVIEEIGALEAEFGFELTVSKRLTDLTSPAGGSARRSGCCGGTAEGLMSAE